MVSNNIDWSDARTRPANYIQICDSIAHTYPDGVAHGVQKDAVQNGMDAISGSGPLIFRFDLFENEKGRFLSMSDYNTTGLTGRVLLRPEEYQEELPEEDRWARFESFAFTKADPDARGARGQGKFIFLAASKHYTMLYETLLADDTYRLGVTKATVIDCPMKHWEGAEARTVLLKLTGLRPRTDVGTRIIITDPVDLVIDEICSGNFLQAIEETWFRSIVKGLARISVNVYGQENEARLPIPYPIPDNDNDNVKVWSRENETISVGGVTYRIKHLQIGRRTDGRVREDMRGVAIIHYGMKICCEPMQYVDPVIRDSVFGYIEFDQILDRELRKTINQTPNHYDLQWRKPIPRAIRNYIQDELRQFGESKLGIGKHWREQRENIRSSAENWALHQLSIHARNFDLFSGRGGLRRPTTETIRISDKPIGLAFRALKFPDFRRAPLVKWDEQINEFFVEAFNYNEKAHTCRVNVYVFQGNRQIIQLENRRNIVLSPGSLRKFGPLGIRFTRDTFLGPGVYILRAAMIDEDTGDRLDILNRYIYLEQDPPFRAPFDVQMIQEFPQPWEKHQWRIVRTGDDRCTLYYNGNHPAYLTYEAIGEGAQRYYLFTIFLEGALQLVLDRPIEEDGETDYHPLARDKIEGDPKEAYLEMIRGLSEVKYNVFSEVG
jgi:hypothetical protein